MSIVKTYRVAYIEDEPVLRELFFHQFKNLFGSIDLYPEPREAIEKLQEKPVDLLFCDVWMPEMSGLEVYQEFRKIFPKTPFIFITGDVNFAEQVAQLKRPQLFILPKPCRLNTMRDFLTTPGIIPQD